MKLQYSGQERIAAGVEPVWAFVNAVIDALSPLGVRHLDMPLTRDKVWRAIRDAEAKKT